MSWQLDLLNLALKHAARPRMERVTSPFQARREFEHFARSVLRRPPHLCVIHDVAGNARISCGPRRSGAVLLYFHGGGYIAGSAETHAGMLGRLASLAEVEICVPNYRLAPENPFPAAFDDAVGAWEGLQARGYAAREIILGGDSAGGGLALSLLAHLCRTGRAPQACFAFSPWCDLTLSGDSLRENAERDMMLPVERIEELRGYVLRSESSCADPRVSPLFADFANCPPVLLQYSDSEILRDDSRRMAEKLRTCGGRVTQEVLENAPHVWQLFDGLIPEARRSLRSVAEFIATSRAV